MAVVSDRPSRETTLFFARLESLEPFSEIFVVIFTQQLVYIFHRKYYVICRVVDDTECRWQYLKRQYKFTSLEVQLEALDQINGLLEYEKISNFLGIG